MTNARNHETDRIRLVQTLRRRGIRDDRVLRAIEKTPRELFVTEPFQDEAYADTALPIACGQTISQPYIVAFMTEALALEPSDKVLEVGTGSGYQAAILAHLVDHVFTIERHEELAKTAKARFQALGLKNISTRVGDGSLGWPEEAPFDAIIVTAAAESVPPPLLEQLAIGGRMVIPLGKDITFQTLYRVDKTEDGPDYKELLPVRFVPLIPQPGNQHTKE